jgi:tyrosinase
LDTPDRGGQFNKSPVWDPVLGFGGDGRAVGGINGPDRCIENGPWSQYNVTMVKKPYDPGWDRCLVREFNWTLGERSGSPNMVLKGILDFDTYADFSELDVPLWGFDQLTGGPHAIGHLAVGGEVRSYESIKYMKKVVANEL